MSKQLQAPSAATPPQRQIPFVRYLSLSDDGPALVAEQCVACGARYFDRRLSCARCPGRAFEPVRLPRTGRVGSFTIVNRAAPGVRTPFVSAVVYLEDSTAVKANIIGCPPDPAHVRLGMPVQLTTFPVGVDDEGTEAVAFAFTPASPESATDGM
jgi:uncharacterized OB-fold protein